MTRNEAIDKANKLAQETKMAFCVVWYPGKFMVARLDYAQLMLAELTLEETRIIHRTTPE